MEDFFLMNQDIKVLKFEFNKDLNVITKILEIINLDYAPLNIKNTCNEKILVELNNWFVDRGIPSYRDNVNEILNVFNINSTKELISKDHALSVSDQYWFRTVKENLDWKSINYFDNNYDSIVFADATFGRVVGDSHINSSNKLSYKTPNNTLNGQLRKVWIKKNDINYLYKAAGTIHNFEPINEVLASMICNILEVPHVEYTLEVIHSKRQDILVSVCECEIDKNEEIIPAVYVLTENIGQVKKDIEDYNIYLDILNSHNVPNAKEYVQKMLMLDYIILNEDRHLNNFGIIRDVKTLKWKSVCPIFDTGRSMNTNVTTSYWNFEDGEVKCFTTDFIPAKALEKIFDINISKKQIEELRKLSTIYQNMLLKYRQYTRLTDNEIMSLTNGYLKRVACFESIMSDKDLVI